MRGMPTKFVIFLVFYDNWVFYKGNFPKIIRSGHNMINFAIVLDLAVRAVHGVDVGPVLGAAPNLLDAESDDAGPAVPIGVFEGRSPSRHLELRINIPEKDLICLAVTLDIVAVIRPVNMSNC